MTDQELKQAITDAEATLHRLRVERMNREVLVAESMIPTVTALAFQCFGEDSVVSVTAEADQYDYQGLVIVGVNMLYDDQFSKAEEAFYAAVIEDENLKGVHVHTRFVDEL